MPTEQLGATRSPTPLLYWFATLPAWIICGLWAWSLLRNRLRAGPATQVTTIEPTRTTD